MASESVKKFTVPQILLATAAFLIPLIGGQIPTDQTLPLPSGLGALLASMLGGPFTQGFETPILSHFLIGLLVASAMAISLLQRAVIQLPSMKLTGLMVGFFGLLMISIGLSAFRFVSMASLGEWLLYALTFFASTALLGRRQGPILVLVSMFVGVCVIALYGIGMEYQEMRVLDPSYRIFAGWVNPNATAGIFIIGLMVGIGLLPSLQRGAALLTGIGCILITTALFLTGSKAGLGAVVVGVITFAILALMWGQGAKAKVQRASLAFALLIIGFGLFTAIQKANQPSANTGSPGLGRMAAFEDTQAQSLGFRKLLWKGSLDLSTKNITGYGLGTYRYEGSRTGLTTQTHLAHNNILQLAVEASWLAPLLLIALLVVWLWLMFRGAKSMPEPTNLLRAGIVAALFATFAHGIFESNLYYFGIGLAFFFLMGIGLCLSADSVAPEFTPKSARVALTTLTLLPTLLLAFFGWAEWQRAQIRYALQTGDISTARNLTANLVSKAPTDAEAWNTLHLIDPSRREEAINRAVNAGPSPRILRNQAKMYQTNGKFASAEAAVTAALLRDPNNLNTLRLGLELCQEFGDEPKAKQYAEQMLAVEKTPYFQIRALPQMVETATVDARVYLAGYKTEPADKVELLAGALAFLQQYAMTTIPEVKKYATEGGDFAGETLEKAKANCEKGIRIAKELEPLYRMMGKGEEAEGVREAVGLFEEAAGSLDGTK